MNKNTVMIDAATRLQQLMFDPMEELVITAKQIKSEIQRQEEIRSLKVVEMTSKGTPRAYRAEIHHGLFDKLTSINKELLPYAYVKASQPEDDSPKRSMGLTIRLSSNNEEYKKNLAESSAELSLDSDAD